MAAGGDWFGVRLVVEIRVGNDPPGRRTYEDRLVVVRASSETVARRKAERLARADEESYRNFKGERVSWRFRDVVDTYMILDEKGGPWSVSYVHENPDPNSQHPVVIIDRQKKKVTYTGLYYYLAHFSKFVRPESVRVQTIGTHAGVRAISFRSPNKQIVSELINSRNEDVETTLMWRQRTVRVTLPAFSITTAQWMPQ